MQTHDLRTPARSSALHAGSWRWRGPRAALRENLAISRSRDAKDEITGRVKRQTCTEHATVRGGTPCASRGRDARGGGVRGSDSRSDSAPDPTPRHNAAAGPRPARTNELTWPARGPVPGAAQRRGPLGTCARPSAGQAPAPRSQPPAPGGARWPWGLSPGPVACGPRRVPCVARSRVLESH